jgi:hypothetical protein
MLTITIRANQSGGSSRETFSERVGAAHLRDKHYTAQLIERLIWATIDAKASSRRQIARPTPTSPMAWRRGPIQSCEGLWRGALALVHASSRQRDLGPRA